MMTARDIACALGGRVQRLADGGFLVPCPVPSHGKGRGDRSPSLSICDSDRRLLVHCFAGCAAEDILEELRRRGLLDSSPISDRRRQTSVPERDRKDDSNYGRKQHRKAAWLWSQRRPIAGTIGERYLRTRGIVCALPASLGFLPPWKPGQHPAMIAAFGLAGEPEPGVLAAPRNVGAIHLTLLRTDGRGKASVPNAKLMIGSPGAPPIVVAPPNDLLGLAVTEGIEDALSVHSATGLGVWTAGSAGRMPALAAVIPRFIECVTIYAHADKAGQDGAIKLAVALRMRGNIDVVTEGL
jgi:hypothetical protein